MSTADSEVLDAAARHGRLRIATWNKLCKTSGVAFYIRKTLETGTIRFSVAPCSEQLRQPGPLTFSTGPAGEYKSTGATGLYYSEKTSPVPLGFASRESGSRPRGARLLTTAIIAVGALIILLGIAVIAVKSDLLVGIVEIIIGLTIVLGPIVIPAKRRREERLRLEQGRKEREAEDAQRRQIVGEFARTLEALRDRSDSAALASVRQQRLAREIPYDAVAPLARSAVMNVGYRALVRYVDIGAEGVAREVDQAIDAAGLNPEDQRAVKAGLYRKVVWHLLADGRMSTAYDEILSRLRQALSLEAESLAGEGQAIEELQRVRQVTAEKIPLCQAPIKLRFHEKCHHLTRGSIMKPAPRKSEGPDWIADEACDVYLTSERVIIVGRKTNDVSREKLYSVEVDIDRQLLVLESGGRKLPYCLALPDPIYSAGIIDCALGSGS